MPSTRTAQLALATTFAAALFSAESAPVARANVFAVDSTYAYVNHFPCGLDPVWTDVTIPNHEMHGAANYAQDGATLSLRQDVDQDGYHGDMQWALTSQPCGEENDTAAAQWVDFTLTDSLTATFAFAFDADDNTPASGPRGYLTLQNVDGGPAIQFTTSGGAFPPFDTTGTYRIPPGHWTMGATFVAGVQNQGPGNETGWLVSSTGSLTWSVTGFGIRITHPTTGDLLASGTADSITWSAPADTDSLDIWLTQNLDSPGGTTYNFVRRVAPQDRRIAWIVRDGKSTHCAVQMTGVTDVDRDTIGQRFTIKGFHYSTLDNTGDYVPFTLGRDDWSFANARSNMWAENAWGALHYASGGMDPFTHAPYPSDEYTFSTAVDSVFPSWPTFVQAFGESQCYWSIPFLSYKLAAEEAWLARTRVWGGSCAGFALSSILHFSSPALLRAAWPGMPTTPDLFSAPLGDSARGVINGLWTAMLGSQHDAYRATAFDQISPTATMVQLRTLFAQDAPTLGYLYMANQNGGGGAHAVVPFAVEQDPLVRKNWLIRVYDNNAPAVAQTVSVDTTVSGGGAWSYSGLSGWGGNQGLFIEDTAANFLPPPLPEFAASRGAEATPPDAARTFLAPADRVRVFPSSRGDASVSDGLGGIIGFAGNTIVRNLPGAHAIVEPMGDGPPQGYDLPAGAYEVTVAAGADPHRRLTVVTDSLIWTVIRPLADAAVADRVFVGGGVSVKGVAGAASYDLRATAPYAAEDRRWTLRGLSLGGADSVHLQVTGDFGLRVVNTGSAHTYDLIAERSTVDGPADFRHAGIALPAGAVHEVRATWSALAGSTVAVLQDAGNDGVFEDTLHVDDDGVTSVRTPDAPGGTSLRARFTPVGFSHVTRTATFRVETSAPASVAFRVFDVHGRAVSEHEGEAFPTGTHSLVWSATNRRGEPLPAGVYAVRYVLRSTVGSDTVSGAVRMVVVPTR